MLVLGIDTATEVAAVGIAQNDHILSDVSHRSRTGHAARLPDLVAEALRQANVAIGDVDAVAVSVGPGSFTGLRVALSFAKGIAFSSDVRLVGVPTLEALATLAPDDARTIAVVLDARLGETYAAVFRRADGAIERVVDEAALSPEAARERIATELGEGPRAVLLGDAAQRYPAAFAKLVERGVSVLSFDEIHPRGSAVALLGAERLARGEDVAADALAPVYVRASAAEQMRTQNISAPR